jgi:hypothetical protein
MKVDLTEENEREGGKAMEGNRTKIVSTHTYTLTHTHTHTLTCTGWKSLMV